MRRHLIVLVVLALAADARADDDPMVPEVLTAERGVGPAKDAAAAVLLALPAEATCRPRCRSKLVKAVPLTERRRLEVRLVKGPDSDAYLVVVGRNASGWWAMKGWGWADKLCMMSKCDTQTVTKVQSKQADGHSWLLLTVRNDHVVDTDPPSRSHGRQDQIIGCDLDDAGLACAGVVPELVDEGALGGEVRRRLDGSTIVTTVKWVNEDEGTSGTQTMRTKVVFPAAPTPAAR